MISKNQNGVRWLEFELLADIPNLKHAVIQRYGGCSEGPFACLNLGYNLGDINSNVEQNLSKASFALETSSFVWSRCVHGNTVASFDHSIKPGTVTADAISTAKPNLPLLVRHADCQAAIFYDPINHVAANVHSGWRGSVANIYSETVEHLKMTYGSNVEDLIVCISPSLGPRRAEFVHYQKELPEHFWDFRVEDCHFNFWEISRSQLMTCGVLSHHIEIASICTYENQEDYFSYRRDKITGRNATVVMLN